LNFDFSDDLNQVRAEARNVLKSHAAGSARRALEGGHGHDAPLWAEIGRLGWAGAAIPEEYGGSGLGAEGLCVIAEEIGRALAATPFASSAYLASQALLRFGSEDQKSRYLPGLADGSVIGCFALAEGVGTPRAASIAAHISGGLLHGTKQPVIDGSVAHIAIVAARGGTDSTQDIVLAALPLDQPEITRTTLATLDPSRNAAQIDFAGARAEILPGARGFSAVETLLDRAAVLFAFEQLGGAQACLDMARDYALERRAFGRQIGSFQAIKHKLADVYVAIEIARSNAYYGAWALGADAPDITSAGAAARVAATHAFELASAENIQTHGGSGFTWEYDCHLYYRRAKHLALVIGAAPFWKDRLIGAIEQRNAA
jgi:alkylation response protein AidB-like acyl-CoA dehydrogenase